MTPDQYDRADVGTPPAPSDRSSLEGAAAKEGSAVDMILGGRRRSLERMAEAVGDLVYERRRLSSEVLAGIDEDDHDLTNLILSLYRPGQPLTDNPLYSKLRVERMRLGRERRQELVSCWRDTSLLGKDVAELAGKVEGAAVTSRLLEGYRP